MNNPTKEIRKFCWAFFSGEWQPIGNIYNYYYNGKNHYQFNIIGDHLTEDSSNYPDFELGCEIGHEKVNADLYECLKWYVDEDEATPQQPFYWEPKQRAIQALENALYTAIPNVECVPHTHKEDEPGRHDCPTCRSCGDPGCCPTRCIQVKCTFGENSVENYYKMQEDSSRYYDIIKALGFDDVIGMDVDKLREFSKKYGIKGLIRRFYDES